MKFGKYDREDATLVCVTKAAGSNFSSFVEKLPSIKKSFDETDRNQKYKNAQNEPSLLRAD